MDKAVRSIGVSRGIDLDEFYSQETIEEWKQILGEDLHYHFGYSTGKNDIDDAIRQTVRNYYQWIPTGSNVLNVGCFWGGIANMLIKEKQCEVRGVAFGSAQADYCRSIGLDVWQSDIESLNRKDRSLAEGKFDVILMQEVLCHIHDKRTLLMQLRGVAPRLIVAMNCLADYIPSPQFPFDGTMNMIRESEFSELLEQTGWRIKFTQNRRFQSLQTVLYWKQNLDRVYGDETPPGQLGVLRKMAELALQSPARWCRDNPLIDIVAEAT